MCKESWFPKQPLSGERRQDSPWPTWLDDQVYIVVGHRTYVFEDIKDLTCEQIAKECNIEMALAERLLDEEQGRLNGEKVGAFIHVVKGGMGKSMDDFIESLDEKDVSPFIRVPIAHGGVDGAARHFLANIQKRNRAPKRKGGRRRL